MESNSTTHSGQILEKEMDWFALVLAARINRYFHLGEDAPDPLSIAPPGHGHGDTFYQQMLDHYQFNPAERLILMLALAPDIKPQLLDTFFSRNTDYDRGFTEFGGIIGQRHSGFLPTVETALFLLSYRGRCVGMLECCKCFCIMGFQLYL